MSQVPQPANQNAEALGENFKVLTLNKTVIPQLLQHGGHGS
jgi:hypothetical protein